MNDAFSEVSEESTTPSREADRQKILNAAATLEDLTVMMSEAVNDMRRLDAHPAKVNGHRIAYARLYFLRRELSRVVATLGAEAPSTSRVRAIETRYRVFIQD